MQPRVSILTLTLGVRDLHRSIAFYRDGLGFGPSPHSNELIAYFPLRGLWLTLFPIELSAIDIRVPVELFGRSPVMLAHHVEKPALVDHTLAAAVAAGGGITKPAMDADWG